ncbi:MAG: LpxD N-terminal domain-containing protein, partial [Microcystis panniformis]
MKFSEIAQKLSPLVSAHSLTAYPDRNPQIKAITPIETALVDTISYIEGGKFAAFVAKTEATALILPLDANLQQQADERGIPWLASANPRLLFAHAIKLFYQPFQPQPYIHATAVVHPSAKIGHKVAIGAHAVVEANVTLGDGVCIHPNAV